MRIRKRLPLPLSSLLPVPVSDPNLINRPPVVVQLNDATSTTPKSSSTASSATEASRVDLPKQSDQPIPPIGKSSDGCDDPSDIGIATEDGAQSQRNHHKLEHSDEEGKDQVGGEKGNDSGKGATFGSETTADIFPSSSPRWCDGEKAIPLKKRRGMSFENATTANNHNNNNNKKMKMKTKMNKKCSLENVEREGEGEETKQDMNVTKKKRGRGSAVMEGSRCSRVNGRGWRCCQPTLVGYSLCEHHLGKGRLRSITSVRSRSSIITAPPKNASSSSSSLEKPNVCITDDPLLGNDDDGEKKPLVITTNKRMKLGMVKARSISSLLGQTKTTQVAVDHDHNNNK